MNKNIYKLTPDVVVVICDYSIREKLAKLLGEAQLPVYFMLHGHGSASSELLEYLGIGEPKKSIAIGITDRSNVNKIYSLLNEEISISKKGRGIAFTIPISSMNGLLYKVCTGQNQNEGGEAQVQCDMEMIMTVVNKGEFDTVMAVSYTHLDVYKRQALDELNSRGMKGVIMDVRDNPGGLLTSVTAVLDELLSEGIITYTEDKYGNKEYEYSTGCLLYTSRCV